MKKQSGKIKSCGKASEPLPERLSKTPYDLAIILGSNFKIRRASAPQNNLGTLVCGSHSNSFIIASFEHTYLVALPSEEHTVVAHVRAEYPTKYLHVHMYRP